MSRPARLSLPLVGMFALLAAAFVGCARLPDPAVRRQAALALAARGGLAPLPPAHARLPVLALGRDGPGEDLTVYIEGDGLAFLNRTTPSPDPTPLSPLALTLALADPAPKLAYLGRPCQYAAPLPAACRPDLWTAARFGVEDLAALDLALDAAKEALGARRLHLVGYSGGGGMAVLLAARRDDVVDLVTVAGNLDTRAFVAWHKVSPMTGSANPMDAAAAVSRLPQVHVSGGADRICPPFLAEAFLAKEGTPSRASRLVLPGVTHYHGYETAWPTVLGRIRQRLRLAAATGHAGVAPSGEDGVASASKME